MQYQEILEPTLEPPPFAAGTNRTSRTERILTTFFSVGLALLSLYTFLGYSGLLARVGWVPKFIEKWFNSISGSKAQIVAYCVCALAGLAVAIYREKKQSAPAASWEKLDYWTRTIIRYFLAYIFLTYGFAKVFHDQFSTPLSVLDTRMGSVSGYWLTWHFFGYSYAYTLFVASSQIVSSILLFFRRTTTLAAMILLPVISNIVFLNFAYHIPVRTYSSIFLIMTVFLLAQDARRIKALVWDNKPFGAPAFPVVHRGMGLTVVKYAVIAACILAPAISMYQSNAAYAKTTTPLAGTWAVQEYKVNGQLASASDPDAWKRFYVDSDRYIGIRFDKPRPSIYFSSFDNAKRTIDLKRGMGPSAKPFFQGSYRFGPNGLLAIDGHDAKGATIQMTLTRVKNTD